MLTHIFRDQGRILVFWLEEFQNFANSAKLGTDKTFVEADEYDSAFDKDQNLFTIHQ